MQPAGFIRKTWMLLQAMAGVIAIAALLAGYWALHHFGPLGTHAQAAAKAAPEDDEVVRTEVTLTPEKHEAAGITTIDVQFRTLQARRTMPAKVEYNPARLLEMKAPTRAVVRRVFVQPGDEVKSGDRLAVLDAPEIGVVRSELDKQQAEAQIRKRDYEWASETATNLEELFADLEDRPSPKEVEADFKDKRLGDNRETLLAAYSKLVLAEQLVKNIKNLVESGAISTRTQLERESAREVAAAQFQGLCEQANFDARRKRDQARAEAELARRLLRVGEQKLSALLGGMSEAIEVSSESTLSEMVLRAPFAGTIQQRFIVDAQRVMEDDPLLTLADTKTLWISVEVRENQWDALQIQKGQKLEFRAPALPDRSFTAEVEFAAGAVSAQTRAAPLVASTPNTDGILKPGMFVWVDLPSGREAHALAVPTSAIMRQEHATFVFVETAPLNYLRVDVKTGVQADQWIAITEGLKGNEKVVNHGAFQLKSELLLEEEE
jgi:RND family efflux transporter MFP subunit